MGESESPARRQAPAAAPGSDDELARLALDYATRSARLIKARPAEQILNWPVDLRPTPAETVLWFHSRIYFKTMRALVGRALTAAGADRFEDPRVCAKQAVIAIDRSRAALRHLRGDDVERTALMELLDEIALGIEERFTCGRPLGRAGTGTVCTKKKPASLLKRAALRKRP